MGLDTSHGCWHGAYSAFARWRGKLAEVAGYPPLEIMDGYFREEDWWFMSKEAGWKKLAEGEEGGKGFSFVIRQVFDLLPVPWTMFKHDPLYLLLYHSDCDGIIAAASCEPLAKRLEEIVGMAPDEDLGGHIGSWHDKTRTFAQGLRKAAAAGEDVDFH
jgi:hypothetical protein